MAEPAEDWVVSHLDVSHLVTEDDEPVENFFQERQMSLLTEALRVSWEEGRPFVSGADIGVFSRIDQEAIVPDVLLSVGVEIPGDGHAKEHRSYYLWNFGKPPDIVIEIVSNKKGGEDTRKLEQYALMKVPYYIIYDPEHYLSTRTLRAFQISGTSYIEKVDSVFPEIGLSLVEWEGHFDGMTATWLRWATLEGELLSVGTEERERAEKERERAEKLAEKLRSLGVDPEDL